ncbi:hypothetical protein DNL40_02285 [Xylanimonas oleitrophica]|uniref:Uncharacterized protein n=1 Tax=Xylanimonas oleitrophica TaxID=2607479 RepID=A0A2W5XX17_9MICO|nr:hypothetical protein [Xylanimonas oleitrophica]PZR55218.1 hypothetical protein DNL40_02285 [Xylanimonas oleitrophica]
MRDGAPHSVMSSGYRWEPSIQAWHPELGMLAAQVPILSGSVSWDVAGKGVPESCTLTVPRYSVEDGRRRDWLPGDDTAHPLATYGQWLALAVVVTSAVTGTQYVTRLAACRVQAWEEQDDGSVRVSGVGLLQRATDDQILVPRSPGPGSTLASELRRMLPAGMVALIDPALPSIDVTPGKQWSGDRLAALYEIADTWPARMRPDADGNVQLLPPLPDSPAPVVTYRDGEPTRDGAMPTLVSAPRAGSRTGVFNSWTVMSSITGDDGQPLARTEPIEATAGPYAVATYGRVNAAWSSDLITSEAQAYAAGRKKLAEGLRPARVVDVQIAPDPRPEPDDAVRVVRDGVTRTGYVLGGTVDLLGATPTSLTVGVEE